ncbi:MAG: prephenate dehydrogenase/arogenate dehydrogenase family protein, partial [Phycisphaerae bacterium]
MSALCELRDRIAALDAEIIRSVAERLAAAEAVGRAKRELGLPLRDYDVERRVLDHACDAANERGVPVELARSVLQLLITESRIAQERLSYGGARQTTDEVLIVGGLGKMGRWFQSFFENQGHRVRVADVPGAGDADGASIDLADGVRTADFIMIATPLADVPASLQRLSEFGCRGVVFDVASLKEHLKPAIELARGRGLSVTSIHPMFGPTARTLSDKVICICDCGDSEATRRVSELFRDTAATLVPLSLEEHDRRIAYVLGLSHAINLLFAAVLADSGLSFKCLTRIGSTTFSSQMQTTETVLRENPELYHAIQHYNPFRDNLHVAMQAALDRWDV